MIATAACMSRIPFEEYKPVDVVIMIALIFQIHSPSCDAAKANIGEIIDSGGRRIREIWYARRLVTPNYFTSLCRPTL